MPQTLPKEPPIPIDLETPFFHCASASLLNTRTTTPSDDTSKFDIVPACKVEKTGPGKEDGGGFEEVVGGVKKEVKEDKVEYEVWGWESLGFLI